MTWSMRALLALVLAVSTAAPASAQVSGRPLEVSGGAGLFKHDLRAQMKRGPAFVGSASWRPLWWMALEGNAALGPSQADTLPEQDHNFSNAGIDLRLNLMRPESKTVPFLLSGFGYGASHTQGHKPDKLKRGAIAMGFGVLFNAWNPRTYLRFQVRDVMFREREALEVSHHIAATVGLHFAAFGKYSDQDLDGVRDWLDRCPYTPIGATVDAHGCPSDADADSIFDGVDKCANTPRGCKVDETGCPIDIDGDGVCDGVDTCADTPKGCTVSATGCPGDADGDGVCDGVDKCADTPKGCTVDATGCTGDADADGICDALDQCANTPAGFAVGPTGCPVAIGEFERTLLDSGVVRVRGIVFEVDGKAVAPASYAQLDSIAAVVVQYPMFKFEIGGPTDVKGEAGVRERLSLAQARAIYDYMKTKIPTLPGAQFNFRGYGGETQSVTEAQRLKGRRAEIRVQNADLLPAERAKRGGQ